MFYLDITSDIDQAMKDINETFRDDIPFAMAGAMVDTMFDVRRRNIESTYPNAFTVRNKALPRKLWAIKVDGSARGRGMYTVLRDALRTGGDAEIVLQQTMDRIQTERHAEGGVKTPVGSRSVAVPVDVNRTKTGKVPAAKRPRVVRDKKNTFIRKAKGGSRLILQRQGKEKRAKLLYVLTPSAKIDKRFAFFEDGIDTIENVFYSHFNTRMNRVIRNSRFT